MSYLGFSLIVLGSLLPWWCAGDVIVNCAFGVDSYNVYLIRFWPTIGFFTGHISLGNIGLIAILLATLIIYNILSDRIPKLFRKMGSIIPSLLLAVFALYQLASHFSMRISYLRVTSDLYLEDGLVLVTYGSLLLITASLQSVGIEHISGAFLRIAVFMIGIMPFTHMLERFYHLYLR